MPKKRDLDERINEAQDFLDRLKLEKTIKAMKAKFSKLRGSRRRRTN